MMTLFPSLKATSLLAAGFALSILPSLAGPVPAFVQGDIFVGFRVGNDPGASKAYLVKLGNDATSFSSTGELVLGDLGADLSGAANYGADWSTREDLHWGIFGVRGTTGIPTVYASRARTTPSVPAEAWPVLSQTRRQSAATQINTVIQSGTGGQGVAQSYIQLQATPNSLVAAFQENGTLPGASSYNFQVTSNSPTDFGSNTLWDNIEGNFAAGPGATVLDVFKFARVGGVDTVSLFGTFSISASGVISFTLPSVTPVESDGDGDGYTNVQEALAGTSDTNASDFFRVSSLTNSAGNTVINFNWIAARSYKIYYSEDLAAGSWQLIDTVTSGPYTDIDPTRTARKKGFYKVAVTNP